MKRTLLISFLSLLIFSCKPEGKKEKKLFTLLQPFFTHVTFQNRLTESKHSNIIQYLYFNNGGGVAAGDINNDGLIDLYFTSNQQPNKLYLNKGGLRFEDITDAAGVAGTGDWKTGVTMADVNGDGLLDIYVCQVGNYKNMHGKNQLFINQGNLTFKEEAEEYGLDFQGFSTQAAFFDYDGDGDLDMYLLNHSVHTKRSYGDVSLRLEHDSLAGDRLYRNDEENGKRVFHDVTRQARIYDSQIGYGLGISISDINNDGFPDIYISNDFHENDYLYLNNGNGTFTEKLTEYIAHTSRSSMGNDIGDINNDGLPDIMVLDMLPDEEKIRKESAGEDDYDLFRLKLEYGYNHQFVRNTLQLNLGDSLFSEIGQLSGVSSTDWSWSPLFCDVDNDGWKDLFITNGIYRRANDLDYLKFLTGGDRNFPKDNSLLSDKDLYEKMPLYPNINYIFRNNGDLTFKNMASLWGIHNRTFSNGATYADLDNDGDLDLIVNNIDEEASIYRNNANERQGNHFFSVVLKGKGMNKKAIGARVTLYHNGQQQVAEQFPTRGFLSAVSDVLHFGLGSNNQIDSLVVRWPDLSEQTLKNVSGDKEITLDIKDAKPIRRELKKESETAKLFNKIKIPGLTFRHVEDAYVDFYRERLIPHSLSAEGPALAVADVNSDGLQDIFIGGAKNQPASLFIQQKDGSFKQSNQQIFMKNTIADDVDAAFFDADGDGDPDLYIVRGGNEYPSGNLFLDDRLLINDGKGGFSESMIGALPYTGYNGSCVRPCDFDGDGDIDLFVGSRSIPGAYGLSPNQLLLENDGQGHFKDVTDSRMKGLKNVGMVTDACWMDYDNDGDMDLIVVGEWMNITVLRNDGGFFTDATSPAGLDETSGWWNCINASDINGDGKLDLICGNLGLNSSLKTSAGAPVKMYLNDFDNNGTVDQIICYNQNGNYYPFASLDELNSQIPGFINKYPNYSDFGGKTVSEIFGKKKLDQSLMKQAKMFESCVFINNGNGTFKKIDLPVYAQFSPVRDISVDDFNKDGKKDLVLVGNNYSVNPSYGRYDASYGWYLQGDSATVYKTLMPGQSGLIVKGDSRKVLPIDISGKHYLIVAVNNGEIQLFLIRPPGL